MKKLPALISVLALLLFLCACSGEAGGAESESVSTEPAASQAVSDGPVPAASEPGGEPSAAPSEETELPEPDKSPEPDEGPSDAVSEEPGPSAAQPSAAVTSPSSAPAASAAPTTAELKAIAESLIGESVDKLYAAIGRPTGSDYAPGCLEPDSEDGELYYDGFTVYTVKTATREYVYDVL